MKHYNLSGTWFDMGVELGLLEAENISAFNRQYFSEMFNVIRFSSLDNVENYAEKVSTLIHDYSPETGDFISGMAKGSGLGERKLMMQVLLPELTHISSETDWPGAGCTSCFISSELTDVKSAFMGQCWDFNFDLPDWYTLSLNPPGGFPRMLIVGAGAVFCCCGINDFGLAATFTSSGHLPNIPPAVGMPITTLLFEVLSSSRYSHARDTIVGPKLAGAFNAMLSDGYTRGSLVESAVNRVELIDSEPVLVCGNHFQHPGMVEFSQQDLDPPDPPAQEFSQSSVKRTERMRHLLDTDMGRTVSLDYLKDCLRDHENYPLSICAHEEETILHFRTMGAVILEPGNQKLHLCPTAPCKDKFQTVGI